MANELVYRRQPSAEQRMSLYPVCRSLHGESTILILEDTAGSWRGTGVRQRRHGAIIRRSFLSLLGSACRR
jgi:hypothetical protein